MGQYYTAKEVMELFKIKTYRTLHRWGNMGLINSLRTGTGRIVFLKRDIDNYLEKINKGDFTLINKNKD